MSLQFVLGSAGCGKTEYVYRQLVEEAGQNPKKNYLVVVPEQFTMQTQQKLVELAPNHAIMNIDVLSFKRLAYRVFDELGMTEVRVLEETGKNLVLRKLAQEQEEKLTVLRPNMNRMGYVGEVKSFISELVQYNVTPQQLEAMANRNDIPSVLAAKLKDIVVMYQAFQDFMEGSYITAEEILNVLKGVAAQSQLLQGSVIVFDEFTGFTPIQNELLKELFLVAERILIPLTIDRREDFYHSRGSEELFDMSKKTISSLSRMASELHVPVLEPVVLEESDKRRFIHAPALAFMEQNLFRPYYQKMHGKAEEISITSAMNPKEELTLVAREINRLVRAGYRYRDMAVVTGAVDTYQSYVEPLFHKYEIPYFLDTTKELLFHPFIECIRAALEVIESGYSYTAVMRFLRCGFTDIPEDDLDRLDNYLVACGLHGHGAWEKRWARLPKETSLYNLERLEELRTEIYQLFEPLWQTFSGKDKTVADGIAALYQLLTELDAEQKLWQKADAFLSQNEESRSREYEQIYRIVMELLEKYHMLLGEEPLSVTGFTEVLEAGLSAAEVAVIPPGYDCVTIGDIERTRLNQIKILFFIGVNDGIIPKNANAGGIISEYEREQLLAADMELAPGAREQAFIQRFYLYRNLTKPSEQLYLSFARTNGEGKAIRPSYLIRVIRQMFPKLPVTEITQIEERADFYTKEAAKDYLIRGRREANWFALAKYFFEGEDADTTKALLAAGYRSYQNEPISKAVAIALYGRKMEGSVTRLERFAACAYAHYLQYGLRLKERELCEFAGVDMGNLYHTALERYSHKLEQSEYDWFTIPDEKREELAELSMQEALAAYPSMSLYATEENAYQANHMQSIFQKTVWALTKQVRAGQFVPEDFELNFSTLRENGADSVGVVALEDDVQMLLKGRIDRLDICENEDGICVKIVDYKSGGTSLDLSKLYQGLQLQLVVYMNAAMELCKRKHKDIPIVPAGILYYNIDDPVLESDEKLSQEEAEHALLLALRPDGLVNRKESIYRAMDELVEGKSDVIPLELKKSGELSEARSHVADTEEFELLSRYVAQQIQKQGQAIYNGEVGVNPYRNGNTESCTYCPYAGVCGIDARLPGYRFRKEVKLSKEEVWERIRTELAKEAHSKNAGDRREEA